ncbi:MAG TPA: M3 family oligoendopeptidase [Candidatus Saccharimonadales bacterium]|nr:M3 family oligoendopeptidase [Candidatus Saccharimonadales bacterium]
MGDDKVPKLKRKFYPKSFQITNWDKLEGEFKQLLSFEINSPTKLIEFWEKFSELSKIITDKESWLYINMTCFADNPEHEEAYSQFNETIGANSQSYEFRLSKKFYDSPFRLELPPKYDHLNHIIANDIEIFREENILLSVAEQKLAAKYNVIVSKMTVDFNGKEKTIKQLDPFLESPDRSIREKAWRLVYDRIIQDKKELDSLFDDLKDIRVKMAKNAGFENYRDYMHQAKGRFSYTPQDLLQLHDAVEKMVVPLISEFNELRKKKLDLNTLKPWDMKVNLNGELPKPFTTPTELIAKSIRTLTSVDPVFSNELKAMERNILIDAGNRKGKAPGGYCSPLYEQGSSFIFMNSVGIRRDIETMLHESGHAMHNMLSSSQPIIQYLDCPSEVAELASMGMELISLPWWGEFYSKTILETVKYEKLMDEIKFLPWGVVVDAFQHWIYTNPNHTTNERETYLSELIDRFKIDGDWDGLEREKAVRWMLQLHFFRYPFYYIEYVIAQLGAIAIYRNYLQNPVKTIDQYKKFLGLAYAKPVSEIYQAAGISFDFSAEYIADLMKFLRNELNLGVVWISK